MTATGAVPVPPIRGADGRPVHARHRRTRRAHRRDRRLPRLLRRAARDRRDVAQGRRRRGISMGVFVGAQQAVQPDLRPVDAVPARSPASPSGSSRSSSSTATGCSASSTRARGRGRLIGGVATGAAMFAAQRAVRDEPAREPVARTRRLRRARRARRRRRRRRRATRPRLGQAARLHRHRRGDRCSASALLRRPDGAARPHRLCAPRRRCDRLVDRRLGRRRVVGGGTVGEALIATVVPLAAIGLGVGLSAPSGGDARGARSSSARGRGSSSRRRLLFVAGGLLVPLVRTVIHLVQGPRQRASTSARQLRRRHLLATTGVTDSSSTPRTGRTSSAASCGGSASPSSVVGVRHRRRRRATRRQAFAAEPGTVIVRCSSASSSPRAPCSPRCGERWSTTCGGSSS